MKIIRNTISILCALALLLSLAPCAFAEELNTEGSGDVTETGSVDIGEDDTYTVKNDYGSAQLKVSENLTNSGKVTINDTLTNGNSLGSLTLGKYYGTQDKLLQNNKTGTIEVSGPKANVTVYGDIENKGTITLESTVDFGPPTNGAWVSAEGTLTNSGTIEITNGGSSGASVINATEIVNEVDGIITLTGDETSRLNADVTNYGTINITKGGDKKTYVGLNYLEKENPEDESFEITGSALDTWTQGEVGTKAIIKLKDYTVAQEGYTFGGWKYGDNVYQANKEVEFTFTGIGSLEALWNKILSTPAAPPAADSEDGSRPEKTEKSGEKIIKYVDAKVLNADRREMEPETEYYKVAKTSYNRLIVTFTWQQMAEMSEGEHLYYIVQPDGTETEYTLTIW